MEREVVKKRAAEKQRKVGKTGEDRENDKVA